MSSDSSPRLGTFSTLSIDVGGMLIFLNYEGFELIANAAKDVANPKRSLPVAYVGGVYRGITGRHLNLSRKPIDQK